MRAQKNSSIDVNGGANYYDSLIRRRLACARAFMIKTVCVTCVIDRSMYDQKARAF
jgi:hypothetical protein